MSAVAVTSAAPESLRPGRLEWAVLAVMLLAAAGFAATTVYRTPGTYLVWADLGLYAAVTLSAAAVCGLRARREPRNALAWAALAASLLVTALGDISYAVLLVKGPGVPYPSVADAFWLASFPLMYMGLLLLLRGSVVRFHPSMWLDAIVGILGAGALAFVLAFDQLLALSGRRLPVVLTNLAYPVADLILLVVAVGVIAILGLRGSRLWWLLTAGLVTYVVADTIYAIQLSAGTYVEGAVLDNLWPFAAACIALAAMSPTGADPRPEPHTAWWGVVLVPACFTVSSLGLLAYGQTGELSAAGSGLALGAVVAGGLRAGLTFREVSRLAEARLQARTDELTGLANRRGFTVGLGAALRERGEDQTVAVLLIDLDRFKEINDALGHHVGDELLRLLGPRLAGCLREEAVLARIGGDEFAIVLPARADPGAADAVAQRISDALTMPFDLDDIALHVGASVGIALCPTHSTDAAELLQHADVAMYDAKASGGGHRHYNPRRDLNSRGRLVTIEGLRAAINSKQLVLHYQPKIHLTTGAVTGTEALVRWHHPERGLLAPDSFLSLAEQTGLMRPLTEHVLSEALGQLQVWRAQGRDLTMAVNISASNLLDVALPAQVAALLNRYGLAAHLVVLEITETTLMADPDRAKQVVASLHQLGVTVSVDDYGTGYSSLAYLRDLSVAELKLDRGFVRDICSDPRASAIVRSTVDLAHSLGMRMVAEGVEDAQAAHVLSRLGCDTAQGFYYSRPVPAAELERWLDEREGHPERGMHLEQPTVEVA